MSRQTIHKVGTQSKQNPYLYYMSTEDPDRMDDIIRMDGVNLKNFKKNPIALFNHNYNQVIGSWENVRIEGKKLLGELKLAAQNTSDLVNQIRALVEQRILKAVSIGFIPLEVDPIENSYGYEFKKWELLECSLVSVPANPSALSAAKSLGVPEDLRRLMISDTAAPPDLLKSSRKKSGDSAIKKPRIEEVRKRFQL